MTQSINDRGSIGIELSLLEISLQEEVQEIMKLSIVILALFAAAAFAGPSGKSSFLEPINIIITRLSLLFLIGLKTMCYDQESNFYIPVDQTKSLPGACEARWCDPKTLEALPIQCGFIGALGTKERPCTVTVSDLTKSYPDCCPKLLCPK